MNARAQRTGLTPPQMGKFFPLVAAAWRAAAPAHGEHVDDVAAMNRWRQDETEIALGAGIRSTSQVDRVDGFDQLMLHFAMIANDTKRIDYYSAGAERRMKHLIRAELAKIGELEHAVYGWSYVKGICAHMQLPEHEDGVPAEALRRILQALSTHRRRILASREEIESRTGLGARRAKHEHERGYGHQGAA